MGIQDLEMELIHEIIFLSAAKSRRSIPSFNKQCLATLRLVCKFFKCVAEPLLFSDIKLDYVEPRSCFNTPKDYLGAMLTPTSPVCCYATSLTINYVGRIQYAMPLVLSDISEHAGCSPAEVLRAITCLTNLREVHWDMRADQLLDFMLNELIALPQLEELTLDCEGYRPAEFGPVQVVPFWRFPYLKRIHIRGSYIPFPFALDSVRQIHELVARGGQMTHLSVAFPIRSTVERSEAVDVLHTIFAGIACDANPPLHHLKLVGCGATLDDGVLPHLSNLSSLDVSYSGLHGQDEAPFWRALQASGIYLTRLAVAVVTQPILEYLATFSGLQYFAASGDAYSKFALGIKPDVLQMYDAQRCSRDLVNILSQRHNDSLLAYLSYNVITGRAPSYMTPDDMVSLKRCSKLRRLAFAFKDMQTVESDAEFVIMSKMVEDALCFRQLSLLEMKHIIPTHRPRLNDGTHRRVRRARERITASVRILASENTLSTGCEVYFNRQSYRLYRREDTDFWALRECNNVW